MVFLKRLCAVLLFWTGLATAATAQPLVDVDWVAGNLDNENVVLIDLRNEIDKGSYETYLDGHIPSSLHSDYLKDGWRVGRDDVVGLLPTEAEFEALARKLGVSAGSHVVLIPAGVNSTDFGSSARAYWTFKVFGHDKVSILNGGYAAWVAAYPGQIETGAPVAPVPGDFVARFQPQGYVSIEQVAALVESKGKTTLLDGRNEAQFYGEAKHPKATNPGRIPGAQMLFQETAYDVETNKLKSVDELQTLYAAVDAGQPVISYCNTGHWAATNWFVLSEVLGRKDVKLYDGSMVEWTANADNPLDTGKSNLDKIKGFFKSILG
ncbi:rhodanese-related sulfurtransferase [SAR116 cluster alpha proteobacterium HIMB100]|nr:rhodanese-related sulfurtransferase [SAR116 cluster alpha proteobacterium HIMB100]